MFLVKVTDFKIF